MMDDRLTRCPQCTTCFAISESELQQAFGVARCGRCKKIFNAANHLLAPSASVIPGSEHAVSENDAPVGHDDPAEPIEENPVAPNLSEDPETTVQPDATPRHTTEAPQSDAESESDNEVAPPSQPPADFEAQLSSMPETPDVKLSKEELQAIRDARQAPQARQQQLEIALSAARDDDPAGLAAAPQLTAEPDTPPQTAKQSRPKLAVPQGMPWIPAAAAAGLIVVILLLLWGNTRTLSQSPGLSGFAEAICSMTGCSHYLPSDFDVLEATQQTIRNQGTRTEAEFVLNNPTANELPFPAILLELRDKRGKIIAEFIYPPEEYLQDKPFADQMLPPDLPITLALPIRAKVGGLESFSLRFYPSPRQ